MKFNEKLGFWGSICSIIGLLIIFMPDYDDENNILHGKENIQINGSDNNVIYNNNKNYIKKNKQDKKIDEPFDVIKYFGFYPGNYWVYNVGSLQGIKDTGEVKAEVSNSYYKDIILSATHDYSLSSGIVTVKHQGIGHIYCDNDKFWYIYNKKHMFLGCTYAQAKTIYDEISKTESYNIENLSKVILLYKFPFEVGNVWKWDDLLNDGKDDPYTYDGKSNAMRNYVFYLSKQMKYIHTPAGKFKNCNEISYGTIGGITKEYVCEGIGLVSRFYDHNGSIDDSSIQLVEYKTKVFK